MIKTLSDQKCQLMQDKSSKNFHNSFASKCSIGMMMVLLLFHKFKQKSYCLTQFNVVSKNSLKKVNIPQVISYFIKESFNSVCHFFGYQGRCAIPSKLDRNLAFTYGKIAKILIENNLTGFCPSVRGLTRETNDWFPLAIPFTHML